MAAGHQRGADHRLTDVHRRTIVWRRNVSLVTIPRELEARGYAPGVSVLVEEMEGGELRIMPTEQVRSRIREVDRRLAGEHAEALKILAGHELALAREEHWC